MTSKDPTRRQGAKLPAVNPADGTMFDVLISHERMQVVAKRSLGHASECAYIVPTVLRTPTAIFEGLRRDEDEDPRGVGWLCYCGIPENSYSQYGVKKAPYSNQVYLVFVNQDKVAYNWRWEQCDGNDPKLPKDHLIRFKKRAL